MSIVNECFILSDETFEQYFNSLQYEIKIYNRIIRRNRLIRWIHMSYIKYKCSQKSISNRVSDICQISVYSEICS